MLLRVFEDQDLCRLTAWAGEQEKSIAGFSAIMKDGDYMQKAQNLIDAFKKSAEPLADTERTENIDRVIYLALYRDKVPAGQIHRQGPLGVATLKFVRDESGDQTYISYGFELDSDTAENHETVSNESFEIYAKSMVKRVLAL